jgi:hypothetical protein
MGNACSLFLLGSAQKTIRFSISHFSFISFHWWIQVGSATAEFAFAPEERDVYSYEFTRKDLAPLGAEPSSGTIDEQAKRLRSYGASE